MALDNQQAFSSNQKHQATNGPSRPIAAHLASRIAFSTAALTLVAAGLLVAFFGKHLAKHLDPEVRRQAWISLSLGLGILAAAVIVTVSWLVRSLLHRRIKNLSRAIDAASHGDYLIRVRDDSPDELGELARGFNLILAKITDLQVNAIDTDRELVSAKDELALTDELASKARIIEQQAVERAARVRELELLIRSTEVISSTVGIDQVLNALVVEAGHTLEFAEAAILLASADGQFEVRATYGFEDGAVIVGMTFAPGEGLTGEVVKTGQPLLIEDTSKDKRYLHYKGRHLVDGSFLCLPITSSNGLVGLFSVLRPRAKGFEESELRLLTALATHAGLAIANAQLVDRLERLSFTDELTGLINRRSLKMSGEALISAQGSKTKLALLMLNIHGLREFNDVHGRFLGDDALKKMSHLLAGQLRPEDILSRWGGKEFVALLPGMDRESAAEIVEHIHLAILDDGSTLSMSAGIACMPENGEDLGLLIEVAAHALFLDQRRVRQTGIAPQSGE